MKTVCCIALLSSSISILGCSATESAPRGVRDAPAPQVERASPLPLEQPRLTPPPAVSKIPQPKPNPGKAVFTPPEAHAAKDVTDEQLVMTGLVEDIRHDPGFDTNIHHVSTVTFVFRGPIAKVHEYYESLLQCRFEVQPINPTITRSTSRTGTPGRVIDVNVQQHTIGEGQPWCDVAVVSMAPIKK